MIARRSLTSLALVGAASLAARGAAQVTVPSEFETPGSAYSPLFSYFGGVAAFGAELSQTAVYSGGSLRCWADFRHDSFFRIAGFAVGATSLDRAAGALAFPPDADTFSISVAAPTAGYTDGQLKLIVTLREDDNGDGVIDTLGDDDAWETDPIDLLSGRRVYNIPLSAFLDTDPDVGNGAQGFSTTGRMALLLTFETNTANPGGIRETPISLNIDHTGLFRGAQTLPGQTCAGDFDRSGGVGVEDLFAYLAAWFGQGSAADIDGAPGITIQDLFDFLAAWFAPCG